MTPIIVLAAFTLAVLALSGLKTAPQLPVTEQIPDIVAPIAGAALGIAVFFFVPLVYALLIVTIGLLVAILFRLNQAQQQP